jgi:two-component system sensor histidine kinase/response regulator
MNSERDDLGKQLELARQARHDAEARLDGKEEELQRVKRELRSALEEVQSANQAKSLFLARMSHEIRTPINAVIGMTRMALESGVSEEQRHFLTTVQTTSEALISLVNNVLDYSKIEVGELDMDAVDFDLRYLVESVMDRVVSQAPGKELESFCLVDANVPVRLAGDPTRLRQILINLLGNAVKFTEQGEVVLRVTVKSEDETGLVIAFSVTDSGAGIPPERLARIFDVFGSVEDPGQQEFNRAGLGLSISRQLVKMMGGTMTVESEVGRGSTIRFTARFQRPSALCERLPTGDPVAGTRVLVVGPMEIPRRAMAGTLTAMGLLPLEAGNGAEALAALDRSLEEGGPLPLVLVDDQLSDMGTAELIRRIRGHRSAGDARLIVLSSHGTRGEVNEYRQAGADGYLIKPVNRSLLFDAVSAAAALPAGRGPGAMMVTRHSLEEAKSRRAWILLAGEDLAEQKQVARMLRGRGLQVGIAGDGPAAVEAAASTDWDVLLIDFRLPGMDGPEVARVIREREDPSGRRLPIIALVSDTTPADMEACLSAGMDGYLTRPLHENQLWNTLRRWLKPVPGMLAATLAREPEAVFDLDPVLRKHQRNMGVVGELAAIFLADTPRGLREIESAVRREDMSQVERIARGLKVACASFGVSPLSGLFAEIETHGREGRPEAALEAQARAVRLFASVEAALEKL